jgi:mannose-6-phosphate isomerase
VPSIANFFKDVNVDDLLDESKFKDTLRLLLKASYDASEETLIECISGMVSDIEAINQDERSRHQRLALRLQKHYHCDIGIIVSFFLNYFELKCGECVVVDVNEPHAWLLGECIELVAASDNVVRGGLTPKYKDIGTFLDMLGYDTKSYIPYMGERNDLGFATQVVYNSGHKEFKLNRLYFHESDDVNDENVITFSEDDSAILFVSKGKGKIVDTKDSTERCVDYLDSFYCLPGRSFNIRKAGNEDFEVYIATTAD